MINLFNEKTFTKIDFNNYTEQLYYNDVKKYGLDKVWYSIIDENINKKIDKNSIIHYENFGLLYEMGLAYVNKTNKQKIGAYYTPVDVANVMTDFFIDLKGENICDVACGTGNLILSLLKKMKSTDIEDILKNKRLFLYDSDKLALLICRHTICLLFGEKYFDNITCCFDDFLDEKTVLPQNAKVISNPPYFKLDVLQYDASKLSEITIQTKELYAAFMEKIIKNSVSSVIITPYSFLSGNKFSKLRYFLNGYSGFFFSFDNVPGNVFNGNKIGTLSSSNRNSVRTTITVVDNKSENGFQTTPLIRFHNEERKVLFNKDFLISLLSNEKQIINEDNPVFCKQFKELENLYIIWQSCSNGNLKDLTTEKSQYILYMPHACRYFTCAVTHPLQRAMRDVVFAKDKKSFYFLYAILNSSFAYWYWRMFDGGINFSSSLALKMPCFINSVSQKEYQKIEKIVDKMIADEKKYVVKKLNAGKYQENIKFPIFYRKELDEILCNVLEMDIDLNKMNLPYSKTITKISGVGD